MLVGHGKDKEKETKHPKIRFVYEAFIKAGEELVKYGKCSNKTQKIVNQNIIDMPKPVEFILKFSFIRKNKMIMEKIFQKAAMHMSDHCKS